MSIPYDYFVGAFLSKISEYDLVELEPEDRNAIVSGYLKRAMSDSALKKVMKVDFNTSFDDENNVFDVDVKPEDIDEVVDIVSEGMLVQWLKQFVYQQELLHNQMNTRDYTLYSPAELLLRVGNAYAKAQSDYTQMIREYSYNHGDLTTLHI